MRYKQLLLTIVIPLLSSCAGAKSFVIKDISQPIQRKEVFPKITEVDGGLINVKNYGAKGDGVTDDTAAFKKALERNEIANKGKTVYVPNGVYLVSDTINWPKGNSSGNYYKRTTLIGESRDKAIIKLKDSTPSFSGANPKPIIDTNHNRANGFFNRIENLTVDTGSGNEQAIAIKINSNNGGGIFDVSVVSEDAQGSHGIDLTGAEIGPLLIKNVSVKGFDTGIKVGGGNTNSVHMENIALRKQNKLGIDHKMQVLTIRNLESDNKVPVILTTKHSATLTLIGAKLNGFDAQKQTAIETRYRDDGKGTPGEKNTINTFLKNIEQTGYSTTAKVYNCETGDLKTITGNIDQWSCGPPLRGFSLQTKTLNLPIEETPFLSHSLGNSVVVKGNSGRDIQKAINTKGVKTVFLPNRNYQVEEPIIIRGSVKKIVGMHAYFEKTPGKPTFIYENGTEPIVSLERLDDAGIVHSSERTLVIKNSSIESYRNTRNGTGDLFLEDVTFIRTAGTMLTREQNVWARSLNVEAETTGTEAKIINEGGATWIMGLKTENPGTIVTTTAGGSTEVMGGFAYINQSIPKSLPLQSQFVNDNSQVSILIRSQVFKQKGYPILIKEKIKDDIKTLTNPERKAERIFPYIGF